MKWFWLIIGFIVGIGASIFFRICSLSALASFLWGFLSGLATSFLGNLIWDKYQKNKKGPYIKIIKTGTGTEFQGYSTDPNSLKLLSKLSTSIPNQ